MEKTTKQRGQSRRIGIGLLGIGISLWSLAAEPAVGPSGNRYEVVFDPTRTFSWEQARAAAAARGANAHLATLRSEAEDLFVDRLRRRTLSEAGVDPDDPATASALWIGGFQQPDQNRVNRGWTWIGDEGRIPPLTLEPGESPTDHARYSNWMEAEPNDWPSAIEDGEETFLAIGHRGAFGWNDRTLPTNGFVVEYEDETEVVRFGPVPGPSGHYYEVILESVAREWEDADHAARGMIHEGMAGHLATITSLEEDDFVDLLRRQAIQAAGYDPEAPATHPQLWIGGFQSPGASSVDSGWRWIRGDGAIPPGETADAYANWNPEEPNDWPSETEDHEEDYLAIGFRGESGWNDRSLPAPGYVVEYDSPIETFPRDRSSYYRGTDLVVYDFEPRFNRNVPMTLEAWVYREDAARCEFVISQGSRTSFALGFCGERPRFYRSGGDFAEADTGVAAFRWTHVAATYDGTTVRFYLNGQPAGSTSLANAGASSRTDVFLGGDVDTPGGRFLGYIDEVRVWSRMLNAEEIRQRRFQEVRDGNGLEAVFPWGGRGEALGLIDGHVFTLGPRRERFGILPENLVVPAALRDPTFDGNVDPATEYLGADVLALVYGSDAASAAARLVHTRDYLYVGVEGARLPAAGLPSLNNVVAVYLDAIASTLGFDTDLMQGRVFLADGANGHSVVVERTVENPFTGGTTTFQSWGDGHIASHQLQARIGTERESEFRAPDVEFRFHRSLLGHMDHDTVDRLALRHADNGGADNDAWRPVDASDNRSSEWTEIRYSPFPGAVIPEVTVRGTITGPDRDGSSGPPIPGIPVRLRSAGVVMASTTTDEDGSFEFIDVEVGFGIGVEVTLEAPPGSRFIAPTASGPIDPLTYGGSAVTYPACRDEACEYSDVDFNVILPPPPVEITQLSRTTVWPPVVVQAGIPILGDFGRTTSTPSIRVDLDNAHEDLDFYILMEHCPIDPDLSPNCVEYRDYFPLESTFVVPDGDAPPYYMVSIPNLYERTGIMPELPWQVPYRRFYRLAAHDRWTRPGNSPTWRHAPELLWVTSPPYPELHGFPFENVADGHDIDDYRAAFHGQVCLPWNALNAAFHLPIYLAVFGGGECTGMVVAAQQLAKRPGIREPGFFDPWDRWALFGNGFPTVDGNQPVLPARFDVGNICSPAPRNVWALIRANQGVQLSAEMIDATLRQLTYSPTLDAFITDIPAALDRLRTDAGNLIVCIRDGDKGHCLQPLSVVDASGVPGVTHWIEVYDPNLPGQSDVIRVNAANNTYSYQGAFSEIWSGSWMFLYDVDAIYGNTRHIPNITGLLDALAGVGVQAGLQGILQVLVAGDAEPLLTDATGGRLGWLSNGTFVESSTEAYPVPVNNWLPGAEPPLGHFPVPMYCRLNAGLPSMTIHGRGSDYTLHASHEGAVLQLAVSSAQDGAGDQVRFTETDRRVNAIAFEAGEGGRTVEARLLPMRNGGEYPYAIRLGNIQVPAGTALETGILPAGQGIRLVNATGKPATPDIIVLRPGQPDSLTPVPHAMPPISFPNGAEARIHTDDEPSYDTWNIDVDEDRDGTADCRLTYRISTGVLTERENTPPPALAVRRTPEGVLVHWPANPDWALHESLDLRTWAPTEGVEATDGEARLHAAPGTGGDTPATRFFRLERVR